MASTKVSAGAATPVSRRDKQPLLQAVLQDSAPTPKSARRTPGRPASANKGDRFIPVRGAMDMDMARFNLTSALLENQAPGLAQGQQGQQGADEAQDRDGGSAEIPVQSPSKAEYKKQLADNLLRDGNGATAAGASSSGAPGASSADPQQAAGSKILAFKAKPPAPPEGHENRHKVLYSQGAAGPGPSRKAFRYVPQAPEKILDAPELVDDYYLNLLDWSSQNVVAVALGPSVYLWDAASGSIEELPRGAAGAEEDSGEHVTSISWAADGKHLAVGLSTAAVQIWDTARLRQVRTMRGHSARVSSMDWNGSTLSTGGRDSLIINHDVRVREHITSQLRGHEQEVCGLKWAPSGNQLASGGNDNLLHIWDAASFSRSSATASGNSQYLHRLDQHQAAVKALAWCPFQSNLLASGGGTADRSIKFWNTHTGACLNSIDTHSQVCALQWSKHDRELLSSHGYSQNQLCLWKYPSMVKMAELTGHTARVLHMAQSPDGTVVASAAADETLRFWRVFGPAPGSESSTGPSAVAGKPLALGGKGKLGGGSRLRSINIR